MRRDLCLALVLLLLANTETAWACSCGWPPPVEELYARASAVFIGRLVRVEEGGATGMGEQPPPGPAMEATVVEVFKGSPPADGRIRAPAPEDCDAPLLLVTFEYVFFLGEGSSIRSSHEAMLIYDSPPADDLSGQRKRLFDQLRSLGEKENVPK